MSRWTLRRISGLQAPADDSDGQRRAAVQRPAPDSPLGAQGAAEVVDLVGGDEPLPSPGAEAATAAAFPGQQSLPSMYGLSALLPAPVVRPPHVRDDDAVAFTGIHDERLRNAIEAGPGDPLEEHSPVLDIQWSPAGDGSFAATDYDGRLTFFGVGDAAAQRLGSAPYSQYLSYDYAQASARGAECVSLRCCTTVAYGPMPADPP